MKIVAQTVAHAACEINHQVVASIEKGLLLYVSFNYKDTEDVLPIMAHKIKHLRIFEDSQGKMNLSIKDLDLPVLSISQFTLEASTKKGHRPSFTDALEPGKAEVFYNQFNACLKDLGLKVYTGHFQAHMRIHSINDGPVTVLLERKNADD